MFRTKLALLSVFLSGSVLVGFGLYCLSVVDKAAMDRIDQEILTLGEGHLATRPPRSYWQNFETSLHFIYGRERTKNLIVQIKDSWNETLFRSPHWPKEITEDSFPNFDRTMATRPVSSGRRDERSGPPVEAYKACDGKSAGNRSEFVDSQGEILKGTCEEENGKLVLRPDANRNSRQKNADGSPGNRVSADSTGAEQPEWLMPRIKKKPYLATLQTSSGAWRVGIMGSDRMTIMVGTNMAGYYEERARYIRAFLAIVPIALLLLAGGGWIIARRAIKPVALITRTAEAITVRDLDKRIPSVSGDSELSRLVEVINGMLDRLQRSFGQAVRFSADAAHELQTPLTILQGELDDAVQHAAVGSEEQQRYSGLLEEVQRLKAIVQKLLILARADAGRLNLCLELTDLSAMIESAAEDASAMAPDLHVEIQIVPGVTVMADADLMGQVIRNLTSNAVKYNHANGLIRFQLSVLDHNACFTLSNTGEPIPAKDREKIFDRFYRVDPSRSKTVPGSGLGLSLAREIIHAHHGDLRLDSDSTTEVAFTMTLPCSSC
ncbi:MAG: Adaptive-response sensory-kinase SasA [Syntrophus sp. SKADARSKE-3]|nr:Adaptive-response sensory-kinase SasA [Syntrophus sp. SKADARSKE-3]